MKTKTNKLHYWFLMRPKTGGFIFFLFLLTLFSLIVNQRYHIFKENKEKEVNTILKSVEDKVNQSLKNAATVALTLALTLDNKGVPKNFDKVADQLIKANPDLKAVQLVPDGIVKYVYPLKGNEAALNLNLFKSGPQTAFETRKAIELKKMYYQGPLKLTQGGVGVVGRLPLYIDNKFWGFSAVVIKLETLYKTIGINNKRYKGYQFQFSKVNEITHKEEFFLPMPKNFSRTKSKAIIFPEGDWKLYVVNVNVNSWLEMISIVTFGLSTAILSSYLLTRLLRKQLQLQNVVNNQASKLIDTESKYKIIFDHAAIGIARVNSKTGGILEVNPYFCNFLGYSETELLTKKIKSIIYPDDLGEDGFSFKQLLAGKIREFNKEKRYINKNGNIIWGNVMITSLWDAGEEPTNHIVIIEDVTKRKAEEQVLIDSQNRLESLINTIDGIVWESIFETHQCIFISEKVKDILGYTVKQWKSSPSFWRDHLHPDDKERVLTYLKGPFLNRKQHEGEYRMIAKDGSVVWIRDIVTVIAEEGQPVKLRGIMIDTTSKVQATKALNKSFNLVTEQNKRLLNFSYIVSHNLRSHASNILGISVLIESAKTEKDRNEMMQLLKKVAENLNETLLNLNNIVNIQTSISIIVEPLNLYQYIINTLTTQNAQILAKQATILNKVDETILVNFNRAYLQSILLNIVSNALRYSHSDRKPIISITCLEENDQLVLRISDNGIGIDLAKYGDKMFGMYQTFNGNADAKGYGLFITKNQIEAMGGKIEVESILNKGTTFKIYFKP